MDFTKNIFSFIVASVLVLGAYAQQTTFLNEGQSLFGTDMLRPMQPSHYYEEQFLRDSTYTFLLQSDTSQALEWQLTEKLLYAYNPQGLSTSQVRSSLADGVWQLEELSQHAYNVGNDLIETLKSIRNEAGNDWEFSERNMRYYTYGGLEEELLSEKWDGLRWKSNMRITKEYNEVEDMTRRTRFTWNKETADWMPTNRVLYTYSDAAILKAETFQNWLDSADIWINATKRSFFYDEGDILIETVISSWDPIQDAFIDDAITTWGYGENGQPEIMDFRPLGGKDVSGFTTTSAAYNEDGLIDELVSQKWDSESESWEPFRYDQHFWSTYLTGNPETGSSDILCQFANPYTQGLPWHCESLKADVQYTLDVYDLLGRHYHATTFMGNHTFRVRANLPPGFYLFVIRGGLDQHSEKVFVR